MPPARAIAVTLLAALAPLQGCGAPEGPAPRAPSTQPTQAGAPAGTPRIDSARDLPPLPLPDLLPVTVYTRTAPVSLVNERGEPLSILTGHHTRLELRHSYKDRALVACELCPSPVEGWVQLNMLMPSDHQPSDEELRDPRLSLALYAAALRGGLEREGSMPGYQPDEDQRALLLRLMDQGFVEEQGRAMAPAAGRAYLREGAAIRLESSDGQWTVRAVELPGEAGTEMPRAPSGATP
jgi:hypothetical protein